MSRGTFLREVRFLLLLVALLIIVTSFRFNMNDLWILKKITGVDDYSFLADNGKIYKKLPVDVYNYLLLVKFFRTIRNSHKKELELPLPPFSYRLLPAFLASFIPADEMTSLNIGNIVALIITLLFLKFILIKLKVSFISQYIGLLMFILSFPLLYYGVIGYIDPFLLMFLSIGFFMIITKRWALYLLSIFIGNFAKEGIAILLPLPFVEYILENKRRHTIFLVGIMGIFLYLLSTYITRNIIPSSINYFWLPSPGALLSNLLRFRTYFSVLMSFGIVGILVLLAIFEPEINRDNNFYLLLAGIITSLLFFLLGLSSVYTDGRYIWPSYIFFIPLAALYIDYRILAHRNKTTSQK